MCPELKTTKNSLPFPSIYDILPLAVEKLRRPRPPDGKVEETSPGKPGTHTWGISTDGSARHSHCRGQGFDSPMLHTSASFDFQGSQLFYFLVTS